MKKCKCGNEMEDKYIICSSCFSKKLPASEAKSSESGKILEILQQMNWNLGMISKTLQALLPKEKLKEIKEQMKQK